MHAVTRDGNVIGYAPEGDNYPIDEIVLADNIVGTRVKMNPEWAALCGSSGGGVIVSVGGNSAVIKWDGGPHSLPWRSSVKLHQIVIEGGRHEQHH